LADQDVTRSIGIDVAEALHAICARGKGRCWYCDAKLPAAQRAIRTGWDVRKIDEDPVASIILVCPGCAGKRKRPAALGRSLAVGA
jgi:hypothetical protein